MSERHSNEQPTDVPSEEEVFEHFLGRAAPELSRRVSAYLRKNPEKERELREWALIETSFKDFPLRSPKALVLNRVRNMAREQAPRPASAGWLAGLKSRFSARELALVFTLVVAVLIHHAMRSPRFAVPVKTASNETTLSANADKNLMASRTELYAAPAALSGTMTAADEIILALSNYDGAVELYQAGRFQEASHEFSDIMSMRPNFEKRRELYTYWVETLKKLGKYGLAEKKQKILEDIVNEESPNR